MKLAYSVATPEVAGSLMSFYGNFKQNITDIKAIGYEALKLFVRNPDETKLPPTKVGGFAHKCASD